MKSVDTLSSCRWDLSDQPEAARAAALALVESGGVVQLPGLVLPPAAGPYRHLLDPAMADPRRKNISLDPATGALHGVLGDDAARESVRRLLSAYRDCCLQLVDALAPQYRGALRLAPASLRLQRAEGRASSWRKDDSRLHIDAFPSRPNYGERILRVFHNINPDGEPRSWRVGEPFADVARHFSASLPAYSRWQARVLRALHVTKTLRSEYDHLMLHLHDAMKADPQYQRDCPQQHVEFEPGSTWVCFSDQTSHAVMGGQFMLEQTLHLPVSAMQSPSKSPLRELEACYGRPLS